MLKQLEGYRQANKFHNKYECKCYGLTMTNYESMS